jgi:carbon monoxide dehydrogenase subunit G
MPFLIKQNGVRTMITYEISIFINRPQQEVWDYVSNPVNYAQWQSSAQSAEWTSEGPPGVGSTFRGIADWLGRRIESKSEITLWDPPKKHSYKSIGGPIPFVSTINLQPKESGTQLTIHAQMEVGGFFKIAEGLVGKQSKKQNLADLESLKKVLER